jgi:hypothetical protein
MNPQKSGYRGIHLVYRYNGRKTEYNGLKIEIQIRTVIQHAWATAVETVGMFTQQALKSSQGEQDWLRYFALERFHKSCSLRVEGWHGRVGA